METLKSSKKKENEREDKRALKRFWRVLLVSLVLGMAIGMLSSFLKGSGVGLHIEGIGFAIRQIGMFASFVATTALLLVICVLYRQAKSLCRTWDGEDENVYRRMETKLSYCMLLTNITMICGYFFFTLGVYVTKLSAVPADAAAAKLQIWDFAIVLCGMIYAIAAMCIAQQKIVNFEKELNPEKKGSVYDPKFTDQWLATSDEAERLIIYKSAYGAFRMMQKAFSAAWVITLLGMMMLETGFFPVAVVLALWMAMVCTYSINSIYYEKHPSEVTKGNRKE